MEQYKMEDGKTVLIMTEEEMKEYYWIQQFIRILNQLVQNGVLSGK